MLDYARICGGTRYVASAILAAQESDVQLQALAKDWVNRLLWPFQAAFSYGYCASDEFDNALIEEASATPLPYKLTRLSPDSVGQFPVPHSLHKRVLVRDDVKCVVTKAWDASSPLRGSDRPKLERRLSATKLVPKLFVAPTEEFNAFVASAADDSNAANAQAPAFVDVLQDFANMSPADTRKLIDAINSPENALLLCLELRGGFTDSSCCLVPDTVDLTQPPSDEDIDAADHSGNDLPAYKVQWLRRGACAEQLPTGALEPFKNHAPRDWELPLPSAKSIAIHAALTHVIHYGGLKRAFFKLLSAWD